MKQSVSQSTLRNSNSLKRPQSAGTLTVNMQKREKLKKLLIEKLTKKFEIDEYNLIEKEVSNFIQKEKLTENDLKIFEEKIRKMIQERKDNQNFKLKLQEENLNLNNNKNSHKDEVDFNLSIKNSINKDNDETNSIYSNMSDLSKKFHYSKNQTGIKYEEITNFELRKLLANERKPVIRQRFDNDGDEWVAINNLKNKLYEETKKENRFLDRQTKNNNRKTFDQQIQYKQIKREIEKKNEDNFHFTMLNTVDKLTRDELMKMNEMKNKKIKEKELREIQIQENINKKKNEFMNNRSFDNQIINKNNIDNDKEKQKELQKKLEAKENLKKMLQDNEEYKNRQKEEFKKERDQDIKFMDDYTKILEKQEQDRADYFKKCESRQKEAMSRMAETVIKQKDLKEKEDEEKMRRYQEEKEKKDQEEEERRKKAIKNGKSYMREYLSNQMVEKKKTDQIVKLIEDEQVGMWKKENSEHFKKEKETNERVKQLNLVYADFLKTQMKPSNKRSLIPNEKMNEEEYRLNREFLDRVDDPSATPYSTKKNFLI